MSIENEIRALIDQTFESTEWEDLLSDTFATLETNYDTQSEVEEVQSELEALRRRFDDLKTSVENFHQSEQYLQQAWKTLSDKLEFDIEEIKGEVLKLKTRKTLLDYLIFWR